jgi:hypothetical protein
LRRARTARADHDEYVWATGDEHLEDLREDEQLAAYFQHAVAGV